MRSKYKIYVNDIVDEGFVHTMEHAGFSASLMKAPKLEDNGNPHRLPPGEKLPVFPISSLPACPESWSRECGTYVCPINVGWGLWFDFTMNDKMNTAVVPSVKGMNPITGRPMTGPELESYQERCPVHGYRWPAQNYLTHESTLWLDGFRQPDGTVRQFFFTEDDKRDIASIVMGKENTMPAFGFVFYKTKEHRHEPSIVYDYSILKNYQYHPPIKTVDTWNYTDTTGIWGNGGGGTVTCNASPSASDDCEVKAFMLQEENDSLDGESFTCNSFNSKDKSLLRANSEKRSVEASVGAGAEIQQDIVRDALGIDGWVDAPSSIIRLYFCFEDQFRHIVESGGVKGIQTKKSGFLQDMPLG